MKIAVTLRIVQTQEYVEPRDAISQDWQIYLQTCGYTPVLIPNQINDVAAYAEEMGIDVILLSNGENVALGKDDQGNWSGSVRDVTEAKLMDWAIANHKPVFGVCRGMQFINCYFGGSLKKSIEGHVTKTHEIELIHDYFKEFYGTDVIAVNSYHRMAVTEDNLGKNLIPWAKAGDILEALVHAEHNILALMWHPEREAVYSTKDRQLIDRFFKGNLNITAGSEAS